MPDSKSRSSNSRTANMKTGKPISLQAEELTQLPLWEPWAHRSARRRSIKAFPFLDFFAGSGLVTEGMRPFFEAVWANDICDKKEVVYKANFPDHRFQSGDIKQVKATDLPKAKLAWASFPCQDLSLAGQIAGIN